MRKYLKTVKFLLFAFALSSCFLTVNAGEPDEPEGTGSTNNSGGTSSTHTSSQDYEPFGIILGGTRPR